VCAVAQTAAARVLLTEARRERCRAAKAVGAGLVVVEHAVVQTAWARRGAGGTAVTGAAMVARSKSGRGTARRMVVWKGGRVALAPGRCEVSERRRRAGRDQRWRPPALARAPLRRDKRGGWRTAKTPGSGQGPAWSMLACCRGAVLSGPYLAEAPPEGGR